METTLNLDQPKENEFIYETLFGSEDSQHSIEFLPAHIQNQGAKPITRMACSRYGMVHAINAQNRYVQTKDWGRYYEIPAEWQWENYLKINPKAEEEGATLQSALDQFTELGYITGYSRLSSIEDMKASLNNARPIYTGSQNGDWAYVRDFKQYKLRTDWRVVWHIFCIVGYNASGWIAINSYGINNGVFYIPYDLTSSLFSRYSISDSRDSAVISGALNKLA